MNQDGSGSDGLLRLLSMLVPGLMAGITWPATAALPWPNRVVIGVAVGVALFAAIHYAVRAALGSPSARLHRDERTRKRPNGGGGY